MSNEKSETISLSEMEIKVIKARKQASNPKQLAELLGVKETVATVYASKVRTYLEKTYGEDVAKEYMPKFPKGAGGGQGGRKAISLADLALKFIDASGNVSDDPNPVPESTETETT